MVWDREKRRAAMFNGQPAIGLIEWRANEIKTQLTDITLGECVAIHLSRFEDASKV